MIKNNEDVTNYKFYKYAISVQNNEILTNNYTKLAVKRFFLWLKSDDKILDVDKIKRVSKFVQSLHHWEGKSAGQRFILYPLQQFMIANIFGWYHYIQDDVSNKLIYRRLIHNVHISVARKFGKSSFMAALALYCLIADEEMGAQCIVAANSREQASILFKMCSNYAKTIDPHEKWIKIRRSDIFFKKTNSYIKVISADSSKQDGYNPSFFILDEFEEAKNDKLYQVLQSGQGNRKNPLSIVIHTAGFNKSSVCYEKTQASISVLENIKTDDSLFCMIFGLDDSDDFHDENCWIKANPLLGYTISKNWLRERVHSIEINPSNQTDVLTKNFNVWTESSHTWIPDEYIQSAMRADPNYPSMLYYSLDFKDFTNCDCYIGVDLSSVSDLTAVSFLFFKNNMYYYKTYYFLPADSVKKTINADFYSKMVRQDYLISTTNPDNVVNYDYITQTILKIVDKYQINIIKIWYDKWNSTQWAIDCEKQGLPLEPFSQALGNFNGPTKQFERLALEKKLRIDYNPVTAWCFRNVKLARDHNDNVKPDKADKNNLQKIDGAISMIEALGGWMFENQDSEITIMTSNDPPKQ